MGSDTNDQIKNWPDQIASQTFICGQSKILPGPAQSAQGIAVLDDHKDGTYPLECGPTETTNC